jgi:two-component system, OmpR family, phosphate regulon response regulator PhoB
LKRIIVIEDNVMAANLYQAALTRDGYRVEIASDGEAGLAAIARSSPDLVLLDLMLPKVDGFEVLRRIRAMPDLAELPVIITSNAYTAPRLEELRRAGATQIVTKASMSPKELTRVVRQALEQLAPRS